MLTSSGTTKVCAHDRAKSKATAARIPSAKPRALTGMRVAGKVMGDASTAEPGGVTAGAESVVTIGAGTAARFIGHRRIASSVDLSIDRSRLSQHLYFSLVAVV